MDQDALKFKDKKLLFQGSICTDYFEFLVLISTIQTRISGGTLEKLYCIFPLFPSLDIVIQKIKISVIVQLSSNSLLIAPFFYFQSCAWWPEKCSLDRLLHNREVGGNGGSSIYLINITSTWDFKIKTVWLSFEENLFNHLFIASALNCYVGVYYLSISDSIDLYNFLNYVMLYL